MKTNAIRRMIPTTIRDTVRPGKGKLLAGAGVIVLALGVGVTSADAEPSESVRFDESFTEVIDDFCGDLDVTLDVHDQGQYVVRLTGPDRLPRYTGTHHGGATYTNLATGKAIFITWNYTFHDVHVTDNGDGTLTILSQIPGPERFYGPDGQVLFTSGGTMRLDALIDHGGTPGDSSDDTFISEEIVSSVGGQPQDPFHFCDSFRTLTG